MSIAQMRVLPLDSKGSKHAAFAAAVAWYKLYSIIIGSQLLGNIYAVFKVPSLQHKQLK